MKSLTKIIERFKNSFQTEKNPIEAAEKLVNGIQIFVGIHDVCGVTDKRFSPVSLVGIATFLCPFLYIGALSQTVHLIHNRTDKMEVFKSIDCLMSTFVPLSEYIFMWSSRKKIKTVFSLGRTGIDTLPDDPSMQKMFKKIIKQAELLSWCMLLGQFAIHFLYLAAPLVFTLVFEERYLPATPGELYGFPNKHDTPDFEVTFAVTVCGTAFSAINQTGFIILFITILGHELAHIYVITDTLNNLYHKLQQKETTDAHVETTLKFCIKRHQYLYKYNDNVEDLYTGIFIAHFCIMSVALVATLQTIAIWDVRNTILTGVTSIMPLFIYCFGGEMLMSAGTDMSTALYSSGWENMKPKQARIVLLMLRVTQRPICLTAAKFFVMNRDTFGYIVQTVYKVYTVFN